MPSSPSPLETHAAPLAQGGSVPFIEYTHVGLGSFFLTFLRFKCAGAMLVSCVSALGTAYFAIVDSAEESARVLELSIGAVSVAIGLGAWAIFAVLGKIRRALQAPPARVLELSRFGMRVCDQSSVHEVGTAAVDAYGRILLPWTSWGDVLNCTVDDATLSFVLRSAPERIDLSMPPARVREALTLAAALWTEARYPPACLKRPMSLSARW